MKYLKKVYTSLNELTGRIFNSVTSTTDKTKNAPSIQYCDNTYMVNYSTSEKLIGTWIDGKPLYRKVVVYEPTETIGATSTVTTVNVPHLITNLSNYIKIECIAKNTSANTSTPLPVVNGATTSVKNGTCVSAAGNANIVLRIINDTWTTVWKFYFIVEYTKTTD